MARNRFEQIQRFLKFCDPHTEPEDLARGKDFWKKLNPLMDDFLDACKKYYILGSNVSVDEQVLKYKGRTKHTMIMRRKKAGKGFKVYTLCQDMYLIDALFTSRVSLPYIYLY